jgi:hypothetical protein
MSHTPRPGEPGPPTGVGPLAGAEPDTGRPIDDPTVSDRANPRWEGASPTLPAQPLANPDGTPNVLPSSEATGSAPQEALEQGTLQDQAARVMDPEVGRDNIREGRGGGTPNPAAAEGGDG